MGIPLVGSACIANHTEKQRVAGAIGPLGTDIENEAIRDRCPKRPAVGGAHAESGIAGTKNPGFAGGFARCRDISSFSQLNGGADGTRTRDLRRDRPAF